MQVSATLIAAQQAAREARARLNVPQAPAQPGFAAAPVGMMLQTPDLIHKNAAKVYQQAVQLKAMPLGNLTKITDQERATIGAWYDAGAK